MNTVEALSALSLAEFDQLLARGVFREGTRAELVDGLIHAQANESHTHALHKMEAAFALNQAIDRAGLPCRAGSEVSSVIWRARDRRVFPDVSVLCPSGDEDPKQRHSDPVVVAEIVSPSSVELDYRIKARIYREHPAIAHYLVIDPAAARVTHHDHGRRRSDEYALDSDARLVLEPPGIELPVRALRVPDAASP